MIRSWHWPPSVFKETPAEELLKRQATVEEEWEICFMSMFQIAPRKGTHICASEKLALASGQNSARDLIWCQYQTKEAHQVSQWVSWESWELLLDSLLLWCFANFLNFTIQPKGCSFSTPCKLTDCYWRNHFRLSLSKVAVSTQASEHISSVCWCASSPYFLPVIPVVLGLSFRLLLPFQNLRTG